jgi:hypothetical protein
MIVLRNITLSNDGEPLHYHCNITSCQTDIESACIFEPTGSIHGEIMMFMKHVLLCALFLLSGCASMFGDSTDQVTIHSNDPNAKLLVNGNEIGTGTAVYSVQRGKSVILTATEKGCADRSLPTEQSIDGITWLDIFFWPGFIVDAATGDMHKTDPTDYTVTPDCRNF